MIFKYFRSFLAALLVAVPATGAAAAPAATDEALLSAYDDWRAGDPMKFARHAEKLKDHVLAPWLEYWRVAMRLEDLPANEVQNYLTQYGDTYPAEILRLDWAKVLGRNAAWRDLEKVAAAAPRPDLEASCYVISARLARGDESALAEAEAMWLEEKGELPEGCEKLAGTLDQRGRLSVTEIWQRVRMLFEAGQITAAKTALGYLPRAESPDERALAQAARTPKRLVERLPKNLKKRATREVLVLAGIRQARHDPERLAEALGKALGKRLPAREVDYLWGRVAIEGARQHHEQALQWYARATQSRLDDEQLAWKVRAALRAGAWKSVRSAIDAMSASSRQEPAWIYWYGRALEAHGDEAGARAYYLKVAGHTDFYGLLANEELGYVAALPETSYLPSEKEVAAASREPGLVRALELIRLGLRTEGVREWLFTIRDFDDVRLLAAAELARRAGVYDRAIQAADRTERLHNFSLRYPVPFRDVFQEYARTNGVDQAWVLGLVRQESRFIAEARSSAGAAGLMQLMPGTARYVARRIGMRASEAKRVHEVETNVTLGTGYMKMVLDALGHEVLASAAYNAGPSRAKRWRHDKPMEGAIYAETIPFGETRDYVKKVMANSVFYAALMQKRVAPIKARLGIIPSPLSGEPVEQENLP
jgi:soluble lytic murein transglycosylase